MREMGEEEKLNERGEKQRTSPARLNGQRIETIVALDGRAMK
jgi:hypothetical protein